MTDPRRAVFLSYASQDAPLPSGYAMNCALRRIEVCFDRSELRGGDAWDEKIRREIRDCALFIPVISANTAARHEGYFRLEWNLADQRSHMIARNRVFAVPVCLDETPEAAADVPESFQRVQWTRLPAGATPEAFVERVRRLLSGEPASPAGIPAPPPMPAAPSMRKPVVASWRSKAALLATIAVVVLALGYFAVSRFILSKHSAEVTAVPAAVTVSTPTTDFNPPPHSIAVLPFADMSEKKDQEYFSDGLTEELLNSLSEINGLQVAARTSSFYLKGSMPILATDCAQTQCRRSA